MELFGIFLLGVCVGAMAVWAYCQAAAEMAEDEAPIEPTGAGGPRPKPAGADMEAQAAGGPRPKV